MKKVLLVLTTFFTIIMYAQENNKVIPMINVSGEGKILATPDQAIISISVNTKGKNAAEIKKTNDAKIEAVLASIKKYKLPKEDFKTQRVSLNPDYDYTTKKYSYNALQTIEINLKDLSKYDAIMEDVVNAGINQINNVEFKSSRMLVLQSEARKLAMKDAKIKAEDYVSVLGQKVGKAIVISDNTQVYYPQPTFAQAKNMDLAMPNDAPRETVAVGEITITANVTVSFALD